jgi:hypothetical protein
MKLLRDGLYHFFCEISNSQQDFIGEIMSTVIIQDVASGKYLSTEGGALSFVNNPTDWTTDITQDQYSKGTFLKVTFAADGKYIAGVPKEGNQFQLGAVPLHFNSPGPAINGIIPTLVIDEDKQLGLAKAKNSYLTEMVLVSNLDSIGLKFTFK